MKGWCLTTCIYVGCNDPYTEHIAPYTQPLFRAYCEKWNMTYEPFYATLNETTEFRGFVPTTGTEIVYASIPHRQQLLERYDGVVYLDLDAIIVDGDKDLCAMVTDEKPIGMIDGLSAAVQVLKSCDITKTFLETVWAMRHEFKRYQWAEEGAFKKLLGWDWVYEHDRSGAHFLGDTEWTKYLTLLTEALCHANDVTNFDVVACNPGGVWPLGKRIGIVQGLSRTSNLYQGG